MEEMLYTDPDSQERTNSFRRIIDTYQISIVRYLFRVTGNLDLAAKWAQEAFVSRYRDISKSADDLEIRNLLYRHASYIIIVHLIPRKSLFRLWRNKPLRNAVSREILSDETSDPLDSQHSLLTLPVMERICAVLHFVEGFSYKTIADMTGLSEKDIRHLIFEVKKSIYPLTSIGEECEPVRELLSVYVDREADGTEKSQVESHLQRCRTCFHTLEEYLTIREKLAALWLTPALPDIKALVMTNIEALPQIKMREDQNRKIKIKSRISFLSGAVAFLVLLAMPIFLNSDTIFNLPAFMDRVQASTKAVSAYQMVGITEQSSYLSVTPLEDSFELNVDSLDSFYVKEVAKTGAVATFSEEFVMIKSDIYWSSLSTSNVLLSSLASPVSLISSMTPAKIYNFQIPGYVTGLNKVGDENIDGVDCVHLRGNYDKEKYFVSTFPQGYGTLLAGSSNNISTNAGTFIAIVQGNQITLTTGGNGNSNTAVGEPITITFGPSGNTYTMTFNSEIGGMVINNKVQMVNAQEFTVDYWIGKQDSLVRKKMETVVNHNQNKYGNYTISTITKFNYPGQSFKIEPPLDTDGSLLPNWLLYQMQDGSYVKVK